MRKWTIPSLLALAGVAAAGDPCADRSACNLPDQGAHAGFVLVLSDVGAGESVADNFTADVDGEIISVCFWGAYVDFGPLVDCGPGAGDDFTLTIYQDAGGAPGAVLASMPIVPTRTATGLIINTSIGPIDEYAYHASLPTWVPVAAGTSYWMEVQNDAAGS